MASRRVRLLKLLLLATMMVVLIGVASVYLLHRISRFQPTFTAPDAGGEREDATQVGRGVDHTVSHQGKPLFRVRGRRDHQDRAGNVFVDDVFITLYREDGSHYDVEAERAAYHPDRKEASLEENVKLSAPQGFVLETERLDLANRGRVLLSEGEVTFYGEGQLPFEGSAGILRGLVEKDQFSLGNGVTIRSRPEAGRDFSLSAGHLLYSRRDRIVRLDEDALITWGGSHISARRIAAHLDSERDEVRFVRARWGVQLDHLGSEDDRFQRLTANGNELSAEFEADSQRPILVELDQEGGLLSRARLLLRTGESYEMKGRHLQLGFEAGVVRSAVAVGRSELVEGFTAVADFVWRRLCAERLTIRFDDEGGLARFDVAQLVQLHEPGFQVSANRLQGTPARLDAKGQPVVLLSERGSMEAPHLVYTRASALAHFDGGVRATLLGEGAGPLRSTPLTEADEPLRVTSEESFWRENPRSFLFRGAVRAWSGDRLLRSGQLRGDLDDQTLTAADDVETVWLTSPQNDQPIRRIELTSDRLIFDDAANQISYQGDVRMEDSGRILTCERLEVVLDDEGQARELIAREKVELVSTTDDRTVRADRAEYDLRDDTALFFGEPVELVDGRGGRMTGRVLSYALQTGIVQMLTEKPARAPSSDPGVESGR